ncbi:MAG: septal ring lytic transglycosylase RlpA family protein [Bacteroidales bacterium]|nr:septal ring lytic transglycosylase RlpA family protein [Bacteroidales bacterium]
MKQVRVRKNILWIIICLSISKISYSQIDTSKSHFSIVTYYSDKFEGRKTANGERFSQKKYTAAHKTYKFGTLLLVTDMTTNKWVIVRVNDRCPKNNVLDLSRVAAKQLGVLKKGSARVKVQPLPQVFENVWMKQELLINLMEAERINSFSDIINLLSTNVDTMAVPTVKETIPKAKETSSKETSQKVKETKPKVNVTPTKVKDRTNDRPKYNPVEESSRPMVFE